MEVIKQGIDKLFRRQRATKTAKMRNTRYNTWYLLQKTREKTLRVKERKPSKSWNAVPNPAGKEHSPFRPHPSKKKHLECQRALNAQA
ncbi:MAG: hypothetical protein HQL74_06620 [Magnetococcales bacterium]|nr:hypothetical protein [Magnetococcales bacterium]